MKPQNSEFLKETSDLFWPASVVAVVKGLMTEIKKKKMKASLSK